MSPGQVQQYPRQYHRMGVNAQISLEHVLSYLLLEYTLCLILPQHWQLQMFEDLLVYMLVLLVWVLEDNVRSMRLTLLWKQENIVQRKVLETG